VDPCSLDATDLAAALSRRELSAVEALDAVLQRADRLAPPLNPFSHRLDERARAQAVAADAERARGVDRPLLGVPVGIKDVAWVAGVETTNGSLALRGFVPDRSSAPVERLEAAGAVLFAKTTNPEFCFWGTTQSRAYGTTSNPWNVERTPGGSSGGAGASLAAGIGPLSLGSDTGGSIRIPAAFCGLVGHKPTLGAVATGPCEAGWPGMTCFGPLARSVRDARLMLGVIAGPDPRERHAVQLPPLAASPLDPRGLRVAASVDLGGIAPVDDDVREAFERTIGALQDAGVEVVRDDPGLPTSGGLPWTVIAYVEFRVERAREYAERRDALGPETVEALEFAETFSAAEYAEALLARERIHAAYADLFQRTGATALLTPTLGCEAFPHGRTGPERIGGVPVAPPWDDWCPFLCDVNLAGLPACAVPVGLGDEGLPVSLQVIGPRLADGPVLQVAELVETLVGPGPRPPGYGG
jgi:Asp-tRNA(Asn)/Glu-tRNA(Gln) amidotransferase A subunit family amidase